MTISFIQNLAPFIYHNFLKFVLTKKNVFLNKQINRNIRIYFLFQKK